jgi:uncharacterized protein (TIGR03083 family)
MTGTKTSETDAPQAEHVHFLFDPRTTLTALAGQRRRLCSSAATFTTDELAAPSRCEGWSVADVLRHLVWVDATMHQIWSGDESPVEGFDPRTTPNKWVEADRVVPDEEIRERYLSSTDAMALEMESADPQRLGHPSLSPLGAVPWWMSAVHIGWDSWIHERDVLIPLDRDVEDIPGETLPCLAYSMVVASFFSGRPPLNVRIGSVQLQRESDLVTAWEPDEEPDEQSDSDGLTVLTGSPVATIDSLSGRGALSDALVGDGAVIDRMAGLARFFTSPV